MASTTDDDDRLCPKKAYETFVNESRVHISTRQYNVDMKLVIGLLGREAEVLLSTSL